MKNLWIVVASRTGARVFGYSGKRNGITLIKHIPNTEGRLRNQEITSDRPGRSFSSAGPVRHSLAPRHEAHDETVRVFAKSLARELDLGRNQNRYDDLMLVAEPGFLGRLRNELNTQTSGRVIATLVKDLAEASERDLMAHLKPITEEYGSISIGQEYSQGA